METDAMRSQSARRALVALGIGVVVALWAAASHAGVVPVGTAELQSLMEREGDRVFLLDVRTPGEYRQGHIAGSVLIPMREVPDRLKADLVPQLFAGHRRGLPLPLGACGYAARSFRQN